MDQPPILKPASSGDLEDIRRLLDANALPSVDVGDHLGSFLIARIDGAIAGVVGVEPRGTVALLRSVCVAADRRGRGLARVLCAGAEAIARESGARDLYLLTTDASPYFEKLGFVVCRRDDVAPPIQATAQFRTLCPSTATVMSKRLVDAGASFVPSGSPR